MMKVSKFQFVLLTVLSLCTILWLLLLTCFKENWAFWQSLEVYSFIKKDYPLWLQQYVAGFYTPTLYFTLLVYMGWTALCVDRCAKRKSLFAVLIAVTLLMGLALGVLLSNNLINFLESGRTHGQTHLQWRE